MLVDSAPTSNARGNEMSVNRSDLRTFVHHHDDTEYVEIMSTETPLSRLGDIYGPLSAARRRAPVQRGHEASLAGLQEARSIAAFSQPDAFCVLGYDECVEGLSDSAMSNRLWGGLVWGRSIIGMDGDEHRHNRSLIGQAFTRGGLQKWEKDVIEPVVHGVIDRFAERGTVDLCSEFAMLFPIYVIMALLGLPRDDVAQFKGWAVRTIAVFYDVQQAFSASTNLADYLAPIIEERRTAPQDDVISLLASAQDAGRCLTNEQIISFVRLLLPAGGETTYRSMGSLLLNLLRNPAQVDAVRADRGLVDQAIDEGLRTEPPLTSISRLAIADTTIGGVPIPKGTVVDFALGTANRDERRWERPDEFDIMRARKPNVAFARGPHTCLGIHLARLELTVALNALLDRLPNLRLDTTAQPEPHICGIGLRSPTHVPAIFG